ncbi:hypothetical protein CF328_g4791 [Tilletia controversa]|nr:hypothetical protein CF328_g4791 [Tilletia controversa]
MTHWRSRLLLAISWLTFTFYSYLHEVGSISLSTADARSVRRSTASNRQLKDSYIVQFFPSENIRPSADRTPVIDDAVHVAFERYLDSSIAGLYTVRHRMTDPRLFFALSLTLHEGANISTLQGFEGVMAIHPITIMDARQVLRPLVRQSNEAVVTPMSKNNTASVLAAVAEAPHRMTGMDRLHAELGGNGIGQLIGIIDLGVDYSLTALNGGKKNGDKCFGDGCPIAGGGALVNDQGNPGWVPDPFADCPLLIHGTHVTGIAIGNDTNQGFVGVAPKARVNLYRLASCTDPFVAVDTVLSAMQRAFHDGVHIISMSISYESGWGSRPIAALASQLVDHGVIIVAANGNDGESGAFYSQSPADAPGVIGAGSVDNDVLLGRTASYVQHGASTDFVYLSAKSIPGNGSPSFPVYVTSKTPSEVNDACQPLPDSTPDLKNFVSCTMDTQINSAVDKGAKRILIYNRNRLGKVYADVYADVGADLHVALIDENVGVDIVNAINAGGKISISFAAQTNVAVNNPVTGRMISYFSQTGPSFDLRITGSVSAPGGSILSTFPVVLGQVGADSGTSMSTPYIASSIAAYRSVKGNSETPAQIRSAITTTATPIAFAANQSILESVARQAGGLINVYAAVKRLTNVWPDRLHLNDTDDFQATQTLSFTNIGPKETQLFTMKHLPAGTIFTAGDKGLYSWNAGPLVPVSEHQTSIEFAPSTFSLAPGAKQIVKAVFKSPSVDQEKIPIFSGFVKAESNTPFGSLTIPYMGVAARLGKIPVLNLNGTSTYFQPSLVEPVGDQSICDDRHSYNLSDDTQLPTLKFQMFAGSRLVTVDLVQANTTFKPTIALQCGHRETSLVSPNDGVLGNVVTLIDLPRDDLQYAVAGPNYTDFKGASKPIPNGHYRFILKALRLDQPSNVSSSYETYVSHAFHIKRP